jgi:hypothetical protein
MSVKYIYSCDVCDLTSDKIILYHVGCEVYDPTIGEHKSLLQTQMCPNCFTMFKDVLTTFSGKKS